MDNGIEITCGKIQSWQVGACKHDVCDGVGLATLALCGETGVVWAQGVWEVGPC